MDRHSLRPPASALGVSYLVAILALGPLLGSSADASSAYARHFDDAASRLRDIVGSIALVIAAAMLVWTVVAARRDTAARPDSSLRDLAALAGVATASTLAVASGLLLTVPLTSALGTITDDPGIDDGVQAGIAQAGTVVLLVAALGLGLTTVLLARLGREAGAVPRWVSATAWLTAATLVLGVSVALLVPFAIWALALGLAWTSPSTRQ